MDFEKKNFFGRSSQWIEQKWFNLARAKKMDCNETTWAGPPMWKVALALETPHFFDKSTASRYAERFGANAFAIEEVPSYYMPSATFAWLAKKHIQGLKLGELGEFNTVGKCFRAAHPNSINDAIDWFEQLPSANPAAAYQLVQLGFAANNPDTTHAIARWQKHSPWAWFSSTHMSGPNGDPLANRPGNSSAMCLFARMLASPLLCEWFFEHQPHLRAMLEQEKLWGQLQHGLNTSQPLVHTRWPAIAKRIFGVDVSPLEFQNAKATKRTLSQLQLHYEHLPAAQCYLSYYESLVSPWSLHEKPLCSNPDVLAFHQKLVRIQAGQNPYDAPSTPMVEQLMLGVFLGQTPDEFYAHAQTMFENANKPPEDSLDVSNLLG